MSFRDDFVSVADQIPFDNDGTSLTSETVQDAIEEVTLAVTGALVNPSTDEAIVRFDGTIGGQQNSNVTISDTGIITLPNITSQIQSGTYPLTNTSGVVDSASTVAFIQDTANTLSSGGAKHTSWRHNGTEFAWISPVSFGQGSFGANTVSGGWAFGHSNTISGSYGAIFGYGNTSTSGGTLTAGLYNSNNGLYGLVAGFGNYLDGSGLFSFMAGINNTCYGNSSVVAGSANYTEGNNVISLGSNLTARSLYNTGIGNNLTLDGGQKITSIGSGISTSDPTISSRPYSFNIAVNKNYNTFHIEKDVRSYIETPSFGIFSDVNLGSELISNGDFAVGTNWTFGTGWVLGTGVASKNADGTGTLTQTITLEVGEAYLLSYDVSSFTVDDETIIVSLPTMGISLTKTRIARTGNKDVFIATSTSDTLTFTPSNLSRFNIDNISLKKMTSGNLSVAGTSYQHDINSKGKVTIEGVTDSNKPLDISLLNTQAFTSQAMIGLTGTQVGDAGIYGIDMNISDGGNDLSSGINIAGSTATGVSIQTTPSTGGAYKAGNNNAVDFNFYDATTGKNTYQGYFFGGNYNNAATPSGRFLSFTKQLVDKFAVNIDGTTESQAIYVKRTANAFGTTNAYTTLVLDGDSTGALYAVGRANSANQPFPALCGWDSGITRSLYFGGGQWDTPDATDLSFWTAPTYTETVNTGLQRLLIDKDGYVVVGSGTKRNNNALFQIQSDGVIDSGISFFYGTPSSNNYLFGSDQDDSRKFKFDHVISSGSFGSNVNIFTYDPTTEIKDSNVVNRFNKATVKPTKSITNADSPYTVTNDDYLLMIDSSGGNVTVNLPTATSLQGRELKFYREDASANTISIVANGSDTIKGSTSKEILFQYTTVDLIAGNNTKWV